MEMNRIQGVMVTLLAIVSLATTVFIAVNLISQTKGARQSLQGGTIHPLDSDGGGLAMDPPILVKLPDFTLTERSGRSIRAADLQGKVCIVDFIFTRCGGPCPAMTAQMAGLQRTLEERPDWNRIRLVTVTVDPDYDTPEVLQQYAGAASTQADSSHWLFLTGSRPSIEELIQGGFKLPVGEDAKNAQMPIFHSTKFVLVDGQRRVRGYYDGLEEDGRSQLMRDLNKVLAERDDP